MGLDVLFQLSGAFVVDSLGLVVKAAVAKYSIDVIAESLSVFVFIVSQLLLDCLGVDGVLYDKNIVGDILD